MARLPLSKTMEKLEFAIEKEKENDSGAVAVLEREENKKEPKIKMTALAEEYLSFNNNEIRLEKDLNDMLEKVNSLEETSPSSEFLKGQLCLELYDIYKNSDKKEKNDLADDFLEQANESFLESVNGEDFEIAVKNKEGEKMIFAGKSHALAYLGDITAKDFYENGNGADWNKSLEYYKKAIEAEPDEGKKYELKVIMDIRKITHYLGDENKLKVWKTSRRIDLRGRTADFSLEYAGNKNGIIKKYIDATKHLRKEKEGWSDTAVLRLDKEIVDFLADIDFESILEEAAEKGDLSEKNKKRLGKIIDSCTELAEKLEKEMENEIKSSEKLNFRKALYLNPNKLAKFSQLTSSERLSQILSE